MKPLPSLEVLDHMFTPDFDAGLLYWKNPAKGNEKGKKGQVAGWYTKDGYHRVCVYNVRYNSHRVLFKMFHRRDPVGVIDHIDGNGQNNSIHNLRECMDERDNLRNSKGRDRDLPKGVYKNSKGKRFTAAMTYKGERLHLGCFRTVEQAAEAYRTKAEELYGSFASHLREQALAENRASLMPE